MISKLARWILKTWGFKVTGAIHSSEPKVMYLVMPHTSNWDFPVGILLMNGYDLNLKWIAKDSLFKFPYGFIFRWLGGIGVDRKKSNNFVDAAVATIAKYENLSLAIAPEGTRKKVDKLKSGFYWIAHKAKVPLVFVKFDWQNKIIDFDNPYWTTGDYEADLLVIENHFRDVVGKIPEYGFMYGK
jgi:1-acyl-sn-glycerol-3-phosphate acyltransferase